MPNFNLGITLKPLPITSVYAAYATSSDPVGAEFDGTSANYGGLAPIVNGNSNQIFGPEKNTAIEVGNKWELFDRHLLVTGALFQTDKSPMRVNRSTRRYGTDALSLYRYTFRASAGAPIEIRGIDLEVSRQDHGQMECVRRPGADAVGGDEVAGASGQHGPLHDQCRPAAGQHRQSVVQPAHQISAHRPLGNWRPGDLPLADLWRHVARREPGHRAAELLALRYVRRSQDRQELDA